MSGAVKGIFKTILKVNIIIMGVYLMFNVFAFVGTYFKMLSFSYIVSQVAIENNYIPPSELTVLEGYLAELSDTTVVDSASIILTSADPTVPVATERRQYGSKVTIGVQFHYRIILPLTPKDQLVDGGSFGGLHGDTSAFASTATLEARRKRIEDNPANTIQITHNVVGLKHYADMR